jgi:hypothetical protein
VTGEILKKPLIPKGVGKAGIRGEILLRKPGDLPAQIVEPADGVFRDGERTRRRLVRLIASSRHHI